MELTVWGEKMTSNLKKNFLVKNLKHLVKCINGYKINQSNDFDETQKDLSKLKNKKLWKKNILIENYKTVKKNRVFKENYYSETAEGIFEYDQYSIRIMKWLCYADRLYYKNVN